MIFIKNDYKNDIILRLSSTIRSLNYEYLFKFVNEITKKETFFYTINKSLRKMDYDYFILNEDSTIQKEDLNFDYINLYNGQYLCYVYKMDKESLTEGYVDFGYIEGGYFIEGVLINMVDYITDNLDDIILDDPIFLTKMVVENKKDLSTIDEKYI